MQPANGSGERGGDLAPTVVATMRQLGVVGLPRNYEIFYEALAGGNSELSLAVVSLSRTPTQQDLDAIGRKFFPNNHGGSIVEVARETIARELEEAAALLRSERTHLEKYGRILGESADGLNRNSAIGRELVQKIVHVVTVATNSTIEHGMQAVNALGERTAELESVKTKLEEYKRLADTDPLTQIWNRRAFDKEIAGIYSSGRGILFKALILVDIDRFKDLNDRFGHPVGDKIIQIIAGILKRSVSSEMFVARTGGEEFALIVEGASEDATAEAAERIRAVIEQTPFVNSQTNTPYGSVTISLGLCMAAQAENPDDLYSKADRALYRSKLAGRNRVTRFSALPEPAGKGWLLYRDA